MQGLRKVHATKPAEAVMLGRREKLGGRERILIGWTVVICDHLSKTKGKNLPQIP